MAPLGVLDSVLTVSQVAICLSSACLTVAMGTWYRHFPMRAVSENMGCADFFVEGLVVATILGSWAFAMFVAQVCMNAIFRFFKYHKRCSPAVVFALVHAVFCAVFGAVMKHKKGCLQFLDKDYPDIHTHFALVCGTSITVASVLFLCLRILEVNLSKKREEKERAELREAQNKIEQQEKLRSEQRENKAREQNVAKAQNEARAREARDRTQNEIRIRIRDEEKLRKQEMMNQTKKIEIAVDNAVVDTVIKISEIPECEVGGLEQCVTCLSEDPTHVFIPCGHMCVCESCANTHAERQDRCPLCRTQPSGLLKVFK